MAIDRPMPVVLVEWKALRKNTLRGFAKIELGALILSELPVHNSSGRRWVGLPARPLLAEDGSRMLDSRGRARWQPLVEWKTRDASDRFSAAVVAVIEALHPGATDEGD